VAAVRDVAQSEEVTQEVLVELGRSVTVSRTLNRACCPVSAMPARPVASTYQAWAIVNGFLM
jgi:hypothetical protein